MFGKKHQRTSKTISPRQANHLAARVAIDDGDHTRPAHAPTGLKKETPACRQ